jgi:anaphase-promoting complex subunit 8
MLMLPSPNLFHVASTLDKYSNVVHEVDLKPRLSFLAQHSTSTDQFRPETCCAVGNFYSSTGKYEKAVLAYLTALEMDRDFASTWTLLGHKYHDLKRTHMLILEHIVE